MIEDESARRTALALIAQYGVDAEVIAMLRAAEYAALGDLDGLAQWDDVLACVARLLAVPSDPHQLN